MTTPLLRSCPGSTCDDNLAALRARLSAVDERMEAAIATYRQLGDDTRWESRQVEHLHTRIEELIGQLRRVRGALFFAAGVLNGSWEG